MFRSLVAQIRQIFYPKIISTTRGYNMATFGRDLGAGIIVGIVALPLAIAFAIASGVTPERGLITAVIAGFLISALGGSRFQIGGPTGAFIVIVYGIVQQFGVNGLIVATFMAGLMLIAMGLLRLGTIIKFMPYPIVVGFTSGIALVIFTSQIKDFVGLSTTGEVPADFVEKWQFYFQHAGTVNYYAVAIAAFTVLVSVWWPKINKRIPGTLIALILTTLAVTTFQFPVETIGSRFGSISASFGSPSLPSVNWATIRMLLAPAFTIAMLGAIESLLSAMVADGATGGSHRSNTELIAQGFANVITPLFGGIPATGAIARTMTNIRNGGRTPIAGIIHALVLLLIMLFVGNLATLIPMSCLAGILVVVAYNMSEWRSFKGLMHNSKSDVAVLLVTFILTVLVDLTVAIQFGLLLAVLLFMRRISETSNVEVLQSAESEEQKAALPDDIFEMIIPKGVEIFEVSGPFFFGVANKFEEAEKQLKTRPKILIIRLRRVPFMDSTALNNLRSFIKRTLNDGVKVILSAPVESVHNSLVKNNIHLMIGPENICIDVHAALNRANDLLAGK
ncbi:MAG: SulP family inorganic anion transporter [Lentimicrobiaceae bacterium]|nr:SulP family inorganic anion transporter [Lentimicrobiaceae bacterium]MDD4596537.1 SulP family inorganic anion transporter [Lentimicrobiaceae bacterium]MDY0026772.1 SulP family inorganic anion transporter [Lentimicrobium sp.]HAH58774.1 sodium-independent anion transporter [Bacteroidales bacterium]